MADICTAKNKQQVQHSICHFNTGMSSTGLGTCAGYAHQRCCCMQEHVMCLLLSVCFCFPARLLHSACIMMLASSVTGRAPCCVTACLPDCHGPCICPSVWSPRLPACLQQLGTHIRRPPARCLHSSNRAAGVMLMPAPCFHY